MKPNFQTGEKVLLKTTMELDPEALCYLKHSFLAQAYLQTSTGKVFTIVGQHGDYFILEHKSDGSNLRASVEFIKGLH